MSAYYAVSKGYSAVVVGPLSEADACAEAEKRAASGCEILLVQFVAICAPKPREVEWQEGEK